MGSQKLTDLAAELAAEKARLLPEQEGFKDLARLNISAEAAQLVSARGNFLTTRLQLITETETALSRLAGHGYPETPDLSVDAALFKELQGQVETIAAAFKRVVQPAEATTAKITAGQVREQ